MRTLALVLAAALALPGAAAAKELVQVKACGASDCTTTRGPDELRAFPTGGESPGAPPPAGAYYTLELTVDGEGEEHSWTSWYAPEANMLAGLDEYQRVVWFPVVGPTATRAIREAVAGIEPFPAPTITSVRIGDRVVTKGAETYLRLFALPTDMGTAQPKDPDWVPVDLRSARPTPWTAGDGEFAFSANAQALERGYELVPLPERFSDAIAAGRPLGDDSGNRLLPWLVLAAVIAGMLVLALLGRALAPRAARSARPSTA